MPIGEYIDLQEQAVSILEGEGQLSHEELQEKLDIDSRDEMQAVIRGLSDNGVIETVRPGSGEWKYTVDDNVDPDKIYD